MIKFFRKIRQNLLMENKTGKYFKYAIGEIVLVVIGILIALSINNWNENRKLENNKQKLLLALKQELQLNKKTLDKHLIGLHKNNSQVNRLINYSAGALELPIDSVRIYSSTLSYPINLSLLNSVFEEAISAGKFEILGDSLKQSLSLLKDFTLSRNNINEKGDNLHFNTNGNNTDLIMILDVYKTNDIENLYVHPPIPKHPDFIKNDEEFIKYIKSSDTYAKISQVYYFNTLDEVWIKYGLLRLTNENIRLINKELSN
jgi:hypothetical protein